MAAVRRIAQTPDRAETLTSTPLPAPSYRAGDRCLVHSPLGVSRGSRTSHSGTSLRSGTIGGVLIQSIKQLVASSRHDGVGVVVFLSRLDEIARLVKEAGLQDGDFAVWTKNEEVNALSSTCREEAQVLFTTQQMLVSRCAGRSFQQCSDFFFQGSPRQVRAWDETLEPGQVITLSTDELGGLPGLLRDMASPLSDVLQDFHRSLLGSSLRSTLDVPELDEASLTRARLRATDEATKERLERLLWLSNRRVEVVGGRGNQRIALDIRDALPADITPLLVLDASGRVRQTYSHWEKLKGGLVRLRPAAKSYSALSIRVLDKGAGKDSWKKNGDQLAMEVATLIDSKPDETWLVIHHKDAYGIDPRRAILNEMKTRRDRVSFLHWGAHQGTNAFKHISNVILAGTLVLPESQYIGLAYASTGTVAGGDIPDDLVNAIQLGEHGHNILQALCRASVRGSEKGRCRPCKAYIIAARKSGIRKALPSWFPGCEVKTWRPRHKPLKGKVSDAVAFLKQRLESEPTYPILFVDLMRAVGIANKANFNRTIRKHSDFQAAVAEHGLKEITVGQGQHKDAFGPVWDPDLDEASGANVQGSKT